MNTIRLVEIATNSVFPDGSTKIVNFFFMYKFLNENPSNRNLRHEMEKIVEDALVKSFNERLIGVKVTRNITYGASSLFDESFIHLEYTMKTQPFIHECCIVLIGSDGQSIKIPTRMFALDMNFEINMQYAKETLLPSIVLVDIEALNDKLRGLDFLIVNQKEI